MPYIETKTNVRITETQKKELREALGTAIELIPGKTERWLMLGFCPEMHMAFAGDTSPLAIMEIDMFGGTTDEAYDAMTAKATEILSSVLGIPKNRIYVRYSVIEHWGWNGENF